MLYLKLMIFITSFILRCAIIKPFVFNKEALHICHFFCLAMKTIFVAFSVRSQSIFFDLTQVDQVVTNRQDLSRSST